MGKNEFLDQPNQACSTIFSIGERGGGKSHVMLNSVLYWLENNVFDFVILILPDYEDEQNDSYAWLQRYDNVKVYESYDTSIGKQILEDSKKNKDENKNKGAPLKKWFLGLDDSTGEGKALMRCESLVKLSTSARHKRVHQWFCLHYTANIIPPKVRYLAGYILIYNLHKELLKNIYKEYINFEEFDTFKTFNEFFIEYVKSQKNGCLLINKQTHPNNYNINIKNWFPNPPK